MTFDVPLTRLVTSRGLAIDEPELRAVFDGLPPSPSLLRRLAPALGLHTADLFAIAGTPVPDDLAPVDPDAHRQVRDLVRTVVARPPELRNELRLLVTSLPQEERTQPPRTSPGALHYAASPGPGAVLMRLLENRNLDWPDIARLFLAVSGRYWAASTYGAIGRGMQPLTPDLVADFSMLLDVSAEDLAVLTGITPEDKPVATGVAELIWDVRRLTAAQIERVNDVAKSG